MTEADDLKLAGIVRELSDAKYTLECLVGKAERWADALKQASERLTHLREGKWFQRSRSSTELPEFPDHDVLGQHLDRIIKERDRIEKLQDRLQGMKVNVS
ncbi:MAG: hypothetical protein OXP09_21510 [Gammaproteobacteria bacterium]|nr:hypothetical protein [Gammaproteobacteria bacterium]